MANLGAISWTLDFVKETLQLNNEETENLYPLLKKLTDKQLGLIKFLCFKKDIETLKDRLGEWAFIYKERV